jgi:uncharacterized protein (UPF0248 family)
MLPIHKLLSRIRWDKEFGQAKFTIGYYDRVAGGIVTIPFSEIIFEQGNNYSFMLLDQEGCGRSIPFHRVRRVFRNRELIWSREGSAEKREK